jgi:hypothetical protein
VVGVGGSAERHQCVVWGRESSELSGRSGPAVPLASSLSPSLHTPHANSELGERGPFHRCVHSFPLARHSVTEVCSDSQVRGQPEKPNAAATDTLVPRVV